MQGKKISIKKLMRDAGIRITDVAEASGHDRAIVCHVIDEEMVESIQQTALKLIKERTKQVEQQLSLF